MKALSNMHFPHLCSSQKKIIVQINNMVDLTISTYHSIGIIYSIHINFSYKSNCRRCFWIFRSTLYFQTVYSVFIVCLESKKTD